MANFSTPFASTGPRRTPNADEKANGFPCGAADQTLFNGMFHRIEAELGEVISYAGLVPTDAQYNQVRLAIQAMIAAATGGGEPEDYVLLNQLTARIPIFPDVQTADGRMNITSPANGIVRVPGGINFLHRGVNPIVTVQTDFNTVSSRTYHLRWNPTDGLALRHLGDNTYNPDGLAESNSYFDSKYDDMLLARVVTSSTNVPTITPLANKSRLALQTIIQGSNGQLLSGNGARFDLSHIYNWARSPDTFALALARVTTGTPTDGDISIGALGTNPEVSPVNLAPDRYRLSQTILWDDAEGIWMQFTAGA